MICANCGGQVEWQGKLTDLTHTKCLKCGAINSQEIDIEESCADCSELNVQQPCEACDKEN